jgi:hypothetical protein
MLTKAIHWPSCLSRGAIISPNSCVRDLNFCPHISAILSTRLSTSVSRRRRTFCSDQAQNPDTQKWKGGVRDTWRDYVGEWINHLHPPFYWRMWRINWTTSVQDYPVNVIWRTIISYVSPRHGWTRTWKTSTELVLLYNRQDRKGALVKLGGVC